MAFNIKLRLQKVWKGKAFFYPVGLHCKTYIQTCTLTYRKTNTSTHWDYEAA